MVYSNNLTKHWKYIDFILKALKGASLQLDINKYKFYKTKVLYLEFVILIDGIQIDPKKIKVIINWQEPKNVKDIRAFIEFANFY